MGGPQPIYSEKILGLAEVKEVFKSPEFGLVAGCMVTEGLVRREKHVRVLRDNVVIMKGNWIHFAGSKTMLKK